MTDRDLPPLLLVDWGSTHLRARLVVDGAILASARSEDGIRNLAGRVCGEVLAALCGSWADAYPGLRVLASGMVGAREGWVEAPYLSLPCGIDELAEGLVTVPDATFGEVLVVPGLRRDGSGGGTDVMRGEETQAAGLLGRLPADGAVLCLPGTHSKWVRCRGGRIEDFRTWITGEAYERLTRDSLLSGDGSPADPAGPAFALGFAAAGEAGGLLHQLFLGRTGMLAGRIAPGEVRSFVSGLLLAHELREAGEWAGGLPLFLVGDAPAAEATAAAMRLAGLDAVRTGDDAHLGGMLAIAARRFGRPAD